MACAARAACLLRNDGGHCWAPSMNSVWRRATTPAALSRVASTHTRGRRIYCTLECSTCGGATPVPLYHLRRAVLRFSEMCCRRLFLVQCCMLHGRFLLGERCSLPSWWRELLL